MIWCEDIVKTILWKQGFREFILFFVYNFPNDRQIQYHIKRILSETKEIENGFPQGAVLSIIFFLVAINDMLSFLPKPIRVRGFADNINLICTGVTGTIVKINQEGLDKLIDLFEKTEFKFLSSKMEYMICSRIHEDEGIKLFLGNEEIYEKNELQILGMIFDNRLSWKAHISNLIFYCKLRLNTLKALLFKNLGSKQGHSNYHVQSNNKIENRLRGYNLWIHK